MKKIKVYGMLSASGNWVFSSGNVTNPFAGFEAYVTEIKPRTVPLTPKRIVRVQK